MKAAGTIRRRTFALVATGGTGGHTYPALALAGVLAGRGRPQSSVRFVGSRRGIEGRVVTDAGYDIDLLPGRGLQRRPTFANLAAVAEAAIALARAVGIVCRYRPAVVVGFGGYASLPCVVAARISRVPIVVHEQDAAPGLANRIAVRLGALPAISLPGTPLPGAVLTGNPVRSEVAAVKRAPQSGRCLIAVWGGSLGARRINDAALGLYDRWRDRDDVVVRHVSGSRDHAACAARLNELRSPGDRLTYDLVEYEEHMEDIYARATLAVCRSGAGTIAELTATGVPSVLVPLPGAPSDHQTRNARTLEDAGAAVLLSDWECDGSRLADVLSGLLGDAGHLVEMGEHARSLGHLDAAERLADLVEECAGAC